MEERDDQEAVVIQKSVIIDIVQGHLVRGIARDHHDKVHLLVIIIILLFCISRRSHDVLMDHMIQLKTTHTQ